MFARAKIHLTEDYYREFYDQHVRYVLRWRKWQTPAALAMGWIIEKARSTARGEKVDAISS